MMQVYAENTDGVLDHLKVDADTGLSTDEVLRRRDIHGPNLLIQAGGKSVLSILLHQFDSIIVWLLAAGAAFSLYLGDMAEFFAILVVLFINGAIGFVTEYRAIRSMEALRRIARVRTRVRRDGKEIAVDARDLVPGDIVLLEEGNVVVADMRLVEALDMHCDESALTGESVPVIKQTAPLKADTILADRLNMAFKGSAVTRGQGEAVVTATGMDTQLGHISALAQSAEGAVTPLERRLDRLGHRLVWLTLALALFTVLVGILRGHDFADMVQTGVALAVAAIPEGLPVVATLTLARGMWRMAARNALISNMPSVETLGATTLIMTDKTGTLTENQMTAVRYLLAGGDIDLVRSGQRLQPTSLEGQAALAEAIRIGALCNSAVFEDEEEDVPDRGDPMELALLVAAQSAGVDRSDLLDDMPRTGLSPFDPSLKMMASMHRHAEGTYFAVKGAPEALIKHCDSVQIDGAAHPLSEEDQRAWIARARTVAGEGLRLLALASKTSPDGNGSPYGGLTLAGIVCLLDPVRPGVPEAIRAAQHAGVRVIMMTGDHADTAATIAERAGLGDGDISVIEGADIGDIDKMLAGDAGYDEILHTDVFARLEPETKLKLVTLFQQHGEVVAVTGDGVNDAPALKKSDIGIAMGQRGTEVAREAADMVLKDDAFSTIIAAMQQGRVIFGNIRSFVLYLMSCNVSEILVVGLAVGLGLPTPLLPLQILFLNLITDVFPAFALGLSKGDRAVMERPPRDPQGSIVTGGHWVLIGTLGGLITGLTLTAFMLALFWLELPAEGAVTVAFLTLALAQLWNVFNMRKAGSGIVKNEVTVNPYVWAALVLCLTLIAAALWLPILSQVLRLQYPGPEGLGLAFGMSLLHYIIGQGVVALEVPRRWNKGRNGGED